MMVATRHDCHHLYVFVRGWTDGGEMGCGETARPPEERRAVDVVHAPGGGKNGSGVVRD
jgi:hypothetical protein